MTITSSSVSCTAGVAALALLASILIVAPPRAHAESAAGGSPEGYKRVPATTKTEVVNERGGGGCSVGTFLLWQRHPDEDLDKPFFAHWYLNEYPRDEIYLADPNPEPFDDEGVEFSDKFPPFSRSSAAGIHQKHIVGTTAYPPVGSNEQADCSDAAKEHQRTVAPGPGYELYVDVPLLDPSMTERCRKAKAKLERRSSKVKGLKRKVRNSSGRKKKRVRKKLGKAKTAKRAAAHKVKKRCT